MSAEHDLAKAIADAVDAKVESMRPESSTMPATYQGTDSEGKAWVLLPGATEPTPVSRMAVEAAQGDTVSVTIANGKATVDSNVSNPSAGLAGVKSVERTANIAKDTAVKAIDYASAAQSAASAAQSSADAAYKHADEAAQEAANAQASAATANAAAVAATEDAGVAHAMAESASADAAQASASATVAKESADKATFALSDVENVVGTLNWIAEHGEYVLTSDTAIVDGKAYYTRSGTDPDYVYTVVASPDASELSTYYELQLDESVQNYLASHLWLDNYGLNLSVDSANGYRIHQGTVDGTHAAGAYILDPQGAIVASFGAGGFQVGLDDESHLIGDYHSLQLLDKEGDTYFWISDLRDRDGRITDTFTGDGSTKSFYLSGMIDGPDIDSGLDLDFTVTVDGSSVGWNFMVFGQELRFTAAPPAGSVIIASYRAQGESSKAYTIGTREEGTVVGSFSVGIGEKVTASDLRSVAIGTLAEATGYDACSLGSHSAAEGAYSVAIGHMSRASGEYSTCLGLGVSAGSYGQTALGKYNKKDTSDTYALIVGNGTSDSARSNALTVDWDGNAEAAGEVTATDSGGNAHNLTEKVDKSGDTMTNTLTINKGSPYFAAKDTGDCSYADNNVTASHYPGFRALDALARIVAAFEGTLYTTGNTRAGFYVRNYADTSTSHVGQKGMNIKMDKQGNTTWTVDDSDGFRSAIAAVKNSGDTVTGIYQLKSTNIDRDGANPSSDTVASSHIRLIDNDGEIIGGISSTRRADGRQDLILSSYNEDSNGTQHDNSLQVRVAKDGTRSFYVGDQGAFRSAIGLNTSTSANITLNSACVAYDTASTPKYMKYGNVVQVAGAVKPASEVAAGSTMTIGTLPSGYRPKLAITTICQGLSNCVWMLRITTGGVMTAERYRNGNTNAAMPTTAWLTFNAVFLV